MPQALISLTLSCHFSLSFIASGRSSGPHPVSSHSCWMYVRAGRPAFAWPYVGVHRSTSLMSSSLLLQQCPACLVRLTWIVFVMGGRWPYSWCRNIDIQIVYVAKIGMKIAPHLSARFIFLIGKNMAALSELISQMVTYLHTGSHTKSRRVKMCMQMRVGRKEHKNNEHHHLGSFSFVLDKNWFEEKWWSV